MLTQEIFHSENERVLSGKQIKYGREWALYLQGNFYLNYFIYNSWLGLFLGCLFSTVSITVSSPLKPFLSEERIVAN